MKQAFVVATLEVKMRIILLLCMVIFPVSGWSQIDSPRPYEPVHADLFRRAQSSALIAMVSVLEFRPVRPRVTDYEVPDLGKVSGGILITLQVESILCAKTDFAVATSKPRLSAQKILVFKEMKPGRSFEGEFYHLAQRYLVFLTPHREQKYLATKYRLEAGTTYYEAFEGERGLISLAGEEPAPVAKIRQFCRALRSGDPNVKIRELTNLLGSGDPELELAIGQAIDFFHRQMMWR
jgi:hypothetical protein